MILNKKCGIKVQIKPGRGRRRRIAIRTNFEDIYRKIVAGEQRRTGKNCRNRCIQPRIRSIFLQIDLINYSFATVCSAMKRALTVLNSVFMHAVALTRCFSIKFIAMAFVHCFGFCMRSASTVAI